MAEKNKRNIVIVCHNIRSAHNVGSIFRTADAAGVAKVYLTGYTPDPTHPSVAKTALGAEKCVAWKKLAKSDGLLKNLKKEKYQIIALEQDKKSVPCSAISLRKNIALILGNEVMGLSPTILKKCDKIIEIPMLGRKESLNVSVAFGIAVYSML